MLNDVSNYGSRSKISRQFFQEIPSVQRKTAGVPTQHSSEGVMQTPTSVVVGKDHSDTVVIALDEAERKGKKRATNDVNTLAALDEVKRKGKKCKTNGVASLIRQPVTHYGQVRVAKYYPGKRQAKMPGFRNVLIHTSGKNVGGDLSPYVLKDEHGQLLENVWQFSKLYPRVSLQRTPKSRFHPKEIVWEHPAERHVDETDEPTEAYWAWRQKGMANWYPVRYPNGFRGRHECLCCLWKDEKGDYQRLGYLEARKRIYCGEYARLAPKTPHFRRLQEMLRKGINLMILEVDGPDPTLQFPPYDRISSASPGLSIDEEVIRMLIDDERKPFGHGYVVAALLLKSAQWLK